MTTNQQQELPAAPGEAEPYSHECHITVKADSLKGAMDAVWECWKAWQANAEPLGGACPRSMGDRMSYRVQKTQSPTAPGETAGLAWERLPTAPGWWWWWCPVQAPSGICVLVHDDGEKSVHDWWVYLPGRAHPSRLGTLSAASRWHGPWVKPEMPVP